MKNMSDKSWDDEQINQHETAAKLCIQIMHKAFDFIRNNLQTNEYEVQRFIVEKFKRSNLVNEIDQPIVAFRENTAFIHYYPTVNLAKKLERGSLIMIDLWARLDEKDAPYADITWMAWYGDEIPFEILKTFDIVKASRNKGLEYIQNHLTGKIENCDIAKQTEDVVTKSGLIGEVQHSFGHSLGTNSPHGIHGSFWQNSEQSLLTNVGYTIEPGIYFENKFGVRSEIDFYVSQNKGLVVTTGIQNEILLI